MSMLIGDKVTKYRWNLLGLLGEKYKILNKQHPTLHPWV